MSPDAVSFWRPKRPVARFECDQIFVGTSCSPSCRNPSKSVRRPRKKSAVRIPLTMPQTSVVVLSRNARRCNKACQSYERTKPSESDHAAEPDPLDEGADRAFADFADAPAEQPEADHDHQRNEQPDEKLFSMRSNARQHSNLL